MAARAAAVRPNPAVARPASPARPDHQEDHVTITDVRVTGDLQQATVFYTVYGTDKDRRNSAAALKSATGLIRSEVGRALGIRLTPSIAFQLDALPDQAKTFEDALARARARDEEIARAYAGAAPAGDADPYRRADTADEPDDDSEGEFGDEEPDDDSDGGEFDGEGSGADGRSWAAAKTPAGSVDEGDIEPEVIA